MPYYPQSASGLNYITYPVGPTTTGLTLTADASANTKGAFTEVIASAPFDANAIIVELVLTNANAGRLFLIDVALGGAGSEVVVVPDLICEGVSTVSGVYGQGSYQIPLRVPAGSRISLRCQSSTGASTIGQIATTLIAAGGVDGITSFVNYGANAGDSGGTAIDPGGTAHTKSGWVELTPSSSAVTQWMGLMVTYGHATVATCSWAVDIGTGPAASEVVLLPDVRIGSATSSGAQPSIQARMTHALTYIPAGTRIAARASCSINTATARVIDVALLAGTAPAEPSGGGGESSFPFVGVAA